MTDSTEVAYPGILQQRTPVSLTGKVAIVTGAAAGIGEAIAELLAAHGVRVYLLDRDAARNEQTARTLPGLAKALACDVRDRTAVQSAVAQVTEEAGKIDILINNAGVYPRRPFLQMDEREWDAVQDINLKGMFHTCQCVLPHMVARGSGSVINISSVTFHVGMANLTHYVASKGGVIGFTRSLAREMGGNGIRVNCLTPGAVLVESERQVATDEQIRAVLDLQSIKRRILPVDVARVCLFLASELSAAMTGQTLNVDGGWVMY